MCYGHIRGWVNWWLWIWLRSGVGATKPIFSVYEFSLDFQNYWNTVYLSNIMFLSGRCPCCWAAVTPARYEYDSKDLINTVVKLDMTVVKKLIKKVSVTPSLMWLCETMTNLVFMWQSYMTVFYDSLSYEMSPVCRMVISTSIVSSLQGLIYIKQIRSSDNDSTGFWAPGSLHTLGADGHI